MNRHLQRIIHEETLRQMYAVLNGQQLLMLHLLLCSDSYSHAADQLGCEKQAVCRHVYNIRQAWLELPELVEAAAGREPMVGINHRNPVIICEVCGAPVYTNLMAKHLQSDCTLCIYSEE